MSKVNVLIAGSTGYIGVELVKLLLNHRYVKIKYLCGNSSVGKNIAEYDKTLKNKRLPKIIRFHSKYLNEYGYLKGGVPVKNG